MKTWEVSAFLSTDSSLEAVKFRLALGDQSTREDVKEELKRRYGLTRLKPRRPVCEPLSIREVA